MHRLSPVLFYTTFLLLTACAPLATPTRPPSAPVPPASYFTAEPPAPTATATAMPSPTPPPTPTPVALDGPVTVLLTAGVPDSFAAPILEALAQVDVVEAANGPQPLAVTDDPSAATTLLAVTRMKDAQAPLLERTYAVVAPFATIRDAITWSELQSRWLGLDQGPLLVVDEIPELPAALLGEPHVVIVQRDDLVDQLESSGDTLALVPFEEIDPRMKVLTINDQSVVDNRFDPLDYPLALALSAQGKGGRCWRNCSSPRSSVWSRPTPTAMRTCSRRS